MSAQSIAPFGLRLPPDLKEWITREARANRRSMNSEIILRLEESRKTNDGAQIGVRGPVVGEHHDGVDSAATTITQG